jgi:outer membrane immunogenic protein
MKRILLSTAALAVAMAVYGTANAADIAPAQMPVKAPPYIAPVYLWSGFYIGANLGYGWGDGSGTVTLPSGATGPISGNSDGILGGGQMGYNWQFGSVVFGVETDIQGTGIDGHFSGSTPRNSIVGTESTPWFGTIRGRLGYAANSWLFYITGGGVYADNKASGTSTLFGPFSSSVVGWSWTVGGGVEAFVAPKWSVKAEYLYVGTPDKVPTPSGTSVSGSSNGNIVRVGVNYHF